MRQTSPVAVIRILAVGLPAALASSSAWAATPQGKPAICLELTRNLALGSRDTPTSRDVSRLQAVLAKDAEIFPGGKVTGTYDQATEAAVRRWQRRHRVVTGGTAKTTGFGTVGPRTRRALRGGCAGASRYRARLVAVSPQRRRKGKAWSMMLWGRQNPKFVRVGTSRYMTTLKDQLWPDSAVLYRFDEEQPSRGWRRVWAKRLDDARQTPSLFVDKARRLHLIYPKAPSRDRTRAELDTSTDDPESWADFDNPNATSLLTEDGGQLIHTIFAASRDRYLKPLREVNTTAWGAKNYYLGASYDPATDRIYVCANHWTNNIFRCGQFSDGAWYGPYGVMSSAGNRYLYPNISVVNGNLWLAAGAHAHRASNSGQRSLNTLVFMQPAGKSWHVQVSRTMGNAATGGPVYIEDDIAADTRGNTYLLLSRLADANSSAPQISLVTMANKTVSEPRPIPGLGGMIYNLYVEDGGTIHVFGGGRHAVSADGGRTWQVRTYYQAAYPTSEYAYIVAHTLKRRSGSDMDPDRIFVLQELQHKTSKSSLVLEIEVRLR